jgi:hypothetical protein
MDRRTPGNRNLAFWLAPMASTIPLILFFGLRVSPWYIGKLMGEPAHPFPWLRLGPWLGTAGVVFDGMLLAYFMAVPVYLTVFRTGRNRPTLLAFCLAGILASQLVHGVQHFRQPGLREFATSWLSPFFGCLCGLAAGACFVLLARRRFSPVARVLLYAMPVAILLACGGSLLWSARLLRAH